MLKTDLNWFQGCLGCTLTSIQAIQTLINLLQVGCWYQQNPRRILVRSWPLVAW